MTISVPRLDRSATGERGITIADFLVPIRVSEGIGVRVRHLALILAGTLFISLAAQVHFYLPGSPVPYTGQTFAVLVAGGALGFRRGVASTVLYLVLGIIGLPVFAEAKHGWEIVAGGTGGYIVGLHPRRGCRRPARRARLGPKRPGVRGGDAPRRCRDLRDRRALARDLVRRVARMGRGQRPDAVPRGRAPEVRAGRARLPGCVVAGRATSRRPLTDARESCGRPVRARQPDLAAGPGSVPPARCRPAGAAAPDRPSGGRRGRRRPLHVPRRPVGAARGDAAVLPPDRLRHDRRRRGPRSGG